MIVLDETNPTIPLSVTLHSGSRSQDFEISKVAFVEMDKLFQYRWNGMKRGGTSYGVSLTPPRSRILNFCPWAFKVTVTGLRKFQLPTIPGLPMTLTLNIKPSTILTLPRSRPGRGYFLGPLC